MFQSKTHDSLNLYNLFWSLTVHLSVKNVYTNISLTVHLSVKNVIYISLTVHLSVKNVIYIYISLWLFICQWKMLYIYCIYIPDCSFISEKCHIYSYKYPWLFICPTFHCYILIKLFFSLHILNPTLTHSSCSVCPMFLGNP